LAWGQRRMQQARELWERVQVRVPQPEDDVQRARRGLLVGFRQMQSAVPVLSKYIGGLYTQRTLPGGGAVYRPVESARQREALRLLTDGLFSEDSFRFRPDFLGQLSPNYLEWSRGGPVSVPGLVTQLQTQVLDRLMDAPTAQRLLDLPSYLDERQRRDALTLDELHAGLTAAVWRELQGGGREVEALRRNLQREHLRRVVWILTTFSGLMPADSVSLVRWHALRLQAQLKTAAARTGLSVMTRAHYAESLSQLTEALRANMTR